MLALSHETCVRTRAAEASCTACVDACPTRAIALDADRRAVVVELSKCTRCGLCQAECPTDSFSGAFDAAAFVAQAGTSIRCGDPGLPCVGAVSAEDLAALAHQRGSLVVAVAGSCAVGDTGHALAARHVDEAARLLRAVGSRSAISFVPGARTAPRPTVRPATLEPSQGRRRLLRLLVPLGTADRLAPPTRLDGLRLRQPPPTARRKRLLASFGSAFEAPDVEVPAADLPLTSAKKLSEAACTGCLACVSACPTGALTVARSSQLRFDASRCVNCNACHEVCEPEALTRGAAVSPAELFELAPRTLGGWSTKTAIGARR